MKPKAVDVMDGEEGDGAIDHVDGLVNDAGTAAEASESATRAAVDAFHSDGPGFSDVMLADGPELVIKVEVIRAIETDVPVFRGGSLRDGIRLV